MRSLLNMVTETQLEYEYDGEGRPVKSSKGSHFYHISDPQPTMNMVVTGYQVWSTVLGSSLTSIKPTGEKLITKVFAGGAVIAKQSHSGANWITADPVTGTEGAYIDNEYGQISTTTEHEPLGQEIFKNDPNDEISDPPRNEIVSYSEGMQWQCEIPQSFYGSFEQMPFHCQVARYNNPNLREEESPSHIDEETPPPGQEPVPEENTPTEKPQAEAGGRDANAGGSAGDGGVPPASIPDDDGDTNEDFEQQVGENGNVSFGEGAGLAVNVSSDENSQVSIIDMSDIPGTDVAQDYAPVPSNLRELVVERLDKDNKKCRNFLDKVRKELKIKKSFEELYDKVINNKGGFALDYSLERKGKGGLTYHSKNKRFVGLRPSTNASSYINVVFHELIHRAGIPRHKAYSGAVFKSLTLDEQKTNERPTKDDVKAKNKAYKKSGSKDRTSLDGESSTYASRLINKYCPQ